MATTTIAPPALAEHAKVLYHGSREDLFGAVMTVRALYPNGKLGLQHRDGMLTDVRPTSVTRIHGGA